MVNIGRIVNARKAYPDRADTVTANSIKKIHQSTESFHMTLDDMENEIVGFAFVRLRDASPSGHWLNPRADTRQGRLLTRPTSTTRQEARRPASCRPRPSCSTTGPDDHRCGCPETPPPFRSRGPHDGRWPRLVRRSPSPQGRKHPSGPLPRHGHGYGTSSTKACCRAVWPREAYRRPDPAIPQAAHAQDDAQTCAQVQPTIWPAFQ